MMFCNANNLPPDVISTKWSEAERVEKSPSATQHCSLSGRFLDYSLREFGLRRPLEMTDIGNALKARNNMFWKCTNRTKQQQFNVSTCRGLHCKPAVPTLFSCPHVDRSKSLMQQTRTRNARPYADNGYFSDISNDSNPYLSIREPNVWTKPTCLPDRNFPLSTQKQKNAWLLSFSVLECYHL